MALTSTFIFRPALNYESNRITVHGGPNIIREMSDNNYKTHSTETDVDVSMSDENGNPTRITHLFWKGTGATEITATPTGGTGSGLTNESVPSSYTTTDGRDVSSVVSGFTHFFYELPASMTATSVRLQLTGTNVRTVAVMLLDMIAEIPEGEFLHPISPVKVDRTGSIKDFPNGSVDRVSVLGAERWKWDTSLALKVKSDTTFTTRRAVLKFLDDNPDIVFALEPARYPARIYPAVQASLGVPTPLRNRNRRNGWVVRFEVSEARGH